MTFAEILIVSIGLAMDAFAVSIGSGTLSSMKDMRSKIRLAAHFGLFQFMMPVIGWYLGSTVQTYVEEFDHWIAFALLSYIGLKMIYESFRTEEHVRQNPSKGSNLVILSVATSIDALAVGFTLAMLDVSIWYPSIIIGIVTAILSIIGIQLGSKLGLKFGKIMEFLGGIVLILIGIKILIDHIS
ncbi:MAG: manganese efflux pump MntP family protein [Ignavibacteria bacterium]|nr:manganese efflux pump MntP family protein [Ignavibacteria bacterium]